MKKEFHYKKTENLNPYIGFTSFQHFCGDPLYSDSVVIPGRGNIETEDFECYPVPEGIEEKGDAQGFYPESSVAYIRALWRDFEPEQGVYNYEFIENILRTAKERGQTVMFRLMQHSTCARDDVPEWLKSIIDCPERPDGMRVKDSPTDPRYIYLFCDAVRKLGERFDSNPTLDVVDVSLVGAWGEGHTREKYDPALLEYMIDTFVEAFPTTQLLCQMSMPNLMERARRGGRRIGTRVDAIGQPRHMEELYPQFLANIPADLWKEGPFSCESMYWLGEWKRQGWDVRRSFDYMLDHHASTFNCKYLPIPFEWRDEVDYLLDRMGYHFVIDSFECGDSVKAGGELNAMLKIDNVGNAPIYHDIPLKIRLKSDSGEYTSETGVDIREWMPGKTDVPLKTTLPAGLDAGKYSVEIAITGEPFPDVYFCSDAPHDGPWFKMCAVTVE